jgi:hypothetical protein
MSLALHFSRSCAAAIEWYFFACGETTPLTRRIDIMIAKSGSESARNN